MDDCAACRHSSLSAPPIALTSLPDLPAKVESVSIDRSTRTATVMVPRTQLSLAIGRDGQNARLAAKLTGFRIDIKPSDSEPLPDAEEPA